MAELHVISPFLKLQKFGWVETARCGPHAQAWSIARGCRRFGQGASGLQGKIEGKRRAANRDGAKINGEATNTSTSDAQKARRDAKRERVDEFLCGRRDSEVKYVQNRPPARVSDLNTLVIRHPKRSRTTKRALRTPEQHDPWQ